MRRAVLFKSDRRFDSFRGKLEGYGVQCDVLDFSSQEWLEYDYSKTDILIYFPSFKYTSNHPLALYDVQDNLAHIHSMYPHLKMFPDAGIIRFYNDKYRQHLFLKARGYPIPESYPLFSRSSVGLAARKLGFPMVIKNRYGAGGDFVKKANSEKELIEFYRISTLDFFNPRGLRHFVKMLSRREFYYYLIKARRIAYPFFSPPLLAQKYVSHECDLKTVVGKFKVVEAHWRRKAGGDMWKVNIDGGGIGEWSYVPEEAIALSERLARDLDTLWLNIDLLFTGKDFLITEFSPVWHHYAFREKPSFVYKEDYNIPVPLEISLDLEKIIVESLLAETGSK